MAKATKLRSLKSSRKLNPSSSKGSSGRKAISEVEEEDSFAHPVPALGPSLSPEQWLIQKLARQIQNGSPEETRKYLGELKDIDLKPDDCQAAVFASRLLDTLVSILESNDDASKLISLDILDTLCAVDIYHHYLSRINIGAALCGNFASDYQSRKIATKAVALFCLFADNKIIQAETVELNVSQKLLGYITLDVTTLINVTDDIVSGDRYDRITLAILACAASRLLSPSKAFRFRFVNSGGTALVQKLFSANSTLLLTEVAHLIDELAKYGDVICKFELDRVIKTLLELLRKGSPELQIRCASGLSSITDYPPSVDVFISNKGVDIFIYFLRRREARQKPELIAKVASALSNCAVKPNTAKHLRDMEMIDIITPYLTEQDEKVLAPCCILLAEIAVGKESVSILRYGDVLPSVVGFLGTATNHRLIVAAATIVGNSVEDPANVQILEEFSAAKLLWFLLNHEESEVVAAAASGIAKLCAVSKTVSDSSQCLAGGLERLVCLLEYEHRGVVLNATKAIGQLSRDPVALKILVDHQVIEKLAVLTKTLNQRIVSLTRTLAKKGRNIADEES